MNMDERLVQIEEEKLNMKLSERERERERERRRERNWDLFLEGDRHKAVGCVRSL